MVDYYRILEITRTATNGDIKKAYRKLALKWHPDKNPENLDESNKKFKEISEAYEVLIDERKRRVYDQYGKEGLQMPGGKRRHDDDFDFGFAPTFAFRDPEDVFRDFFGDTPYDDLFSGFGFPNGGHRSANRHPGNLLCSFFGPMSFIGSGFGGIFNNPPQMGTFSTFSTVQGNTGFGNARSSSTTTSFKNGKKITVKRITENGTETVLSYENDVLKSKTVNGVPHALTADGASTSRPITNKINEKATKKGHSDHQKGVRKMFHYH